MGPVLVDLAQDVEQERHNVKVERLVVLKRNTIIYFMHFFFYQDPSISRWISVLGSSANLREVMSFGLNRLSGEGVDLVADRGLNTG